MIADVPLIAVGNSQADRIGIQCQAYARLCYLHFPLSLVLISQICMRMLCIKRLIDCDCQAWNPLLGQFAGNETERKLFDAIRRIVKDKTQRTIRRKQLPNQRINSLTLWTPVG